MNTRDYCSTINLQYMHGIIDWVVQTTDERDHGHGHDEVCRRATRKCLLYNWFFASLPVSTVTICHAKFRGVVIIAVIRIPVGFISIGWLVAEKIANWCGNVWYQLLFRFAVCRSVEERYFIEAEQQRDLIHYHTNVLFPRQPTNRLK